MTDLIDKLLDKKMLELVYARKIPELFEHIDDRLGFLETHTPHNVREIRMLKTFRKTLEHGLGRHKCVDERKQSL